MKTVNYFEIVKTKYKHNGESQYRIRFEYKGELEESNLFSFSQLNELITYWRANELLGSFAIGYELAKDFTFQLIDES